MQVNCVKLSAQLQNWNKSMICKKKPHFGCQEEEDGKTILLLLPMKQLTGGGHDIMLLENTLIFQNHNIIYPKISISIVY